MPVNSPTKQRRRYTDPPLQDHLLPSFKDGYNSYAQSQSQVEDTEIPRGQNCTPDDNGAMTDRLGKVKASPAFPSGYPTAALGKFSTGGSTLKLALHGDTLYSYTESTLSALTGATFTPTSPENCTILETVGRAYVFNGIDQPYYTSNGTTLTMQTGAFPLKFPQSYNQRLYAVRPDYPDRIYFSNPISIDLTVTGSEPADYSVSNFGTFDVNLTPTPPLPIKNAGYIQLGFDEGVVITGTSQKSSSIIVETLEHGKWQITATGLSSSNTVVHSAIQIVKSGGCPAPLSIFTSNDNQQRYYGGDNFYLYGEVKFFQTPQPVPKSGRVQSEMNNVPSSLKSKLVGAYFNNAEYVFYAAGIHNDRTLKRDTRLDAWSTPYVGWNVSCAFVYTESDGRKRLLAGSSDQDDPYIYELEVGTTDDGAFIDAWFADKNTDQRLPGIPKFEAFSQIFYPSITDSIVCEVYLDGRLIKTHTETIGGSSSSAVGVGTQTVGTEVIGMDGDTASFGIATDTDGFFTIDHGYLQGDKLQILYRKGSANARFRISKRKTYFRKGKPIPN